MKWDKDKFLFKLEMWTLTILLIILAGLLSMLHSCSTTAVQGKTVDFNQYPDDIACPVPNVVVLKGAPEWDDRTDRPNLKTAIRRCAEKFPNSPCLKTFTKIGFQDYTAICAKKYNHVVISPEDLDEIQKEYPDPEGKSK